MRDWLLTALAFVAALVFLSSGIAASVFMAEAAATSGPVEFAHQCLDKGGRASYTTDEELVCMSADNTIIEMESSW